MERTTLVILLDAFRGSYLNKKDTPFLWKMSKEGVWVKRIFNPGGYCERSCFMTGAGPKTTGNFFAFSLAEPGYRRAYWEPTFNVPIGVRARLAMREDQSLDFEPNSFGIESIWDVMRKAKKKFVFEACVALGRLSYRGRTTHGSRPIFILDQIKKRADLYYMQISATDQYGHMLGTKSPAFKGVLRWADAKVEELYKEFKKHFDKVNLLVFGDHGMADVKERVNLLLDFSPFVEGYDYLYLKSSAAVQFWVFNKKVEKRIKEDRQLNKHGKFVPSPSPAQGDIIWLANPYTLVSPCHFHGAGDAPKAMHGWDLDGRDKIDEMRGMAIIVDGKHKGVKKEGDLRDVCPTICDLVGIRYPKKNEGRSFL